MAIATLRAIDRSNGVIRLWPLAQESLKFTRKIQQAIGSGFVAKSLQLLFQLIFEGSKLLRVVVMAGQNT